MKLLCYYDRSLNSFNHFDNMTFLKIISLKFSTSSLSPIVVHLFLMLQQPVCVLDYFNMEKRNMAFKVWDHWKPHKYIIPLNGSTKVNRFWCHCLRLTSLQGFDSLSRMTIPLKLLLLECMWNVVSSYHKWPQRR